MKETSHIVDAQQMFPVFASPFARVSLRYNIYGTSVLGTGEAGVSKTSHPLAFSEPPSSGREKTIKKVFFK